VPVALWLVLAPAGTLVAGRPRQSHAAQKEPILKIYEGCVGELSDKDRADLHRIVREMLATIPKANQ
jgi:hypothetical protein